MIFFYWQIKEQIQVQQHPDPPPFLSRTSINHVAPPPPPPPPPSLISPLYVKYRNMCFIPPPPSLISPLYVKYRNMCFIPPPPHFSSRPCMLKIDKCVLYWYNNHLIQCLPFLAFVTVLWSPRIINGRGTLFIFVYLFTACTCIFLPVLLLGSFSSQKYACNFIIC